MSNPELGGELSPADKLRDSVKLILREYAEALIVAILLALFLRGYVVSAYKVPTTSMNPTLQVGDFIFGYKLPYGFQLPFTKYRVEGRKPVRGDIMIFKCPHNREASCVKRVVAIAGDRIEIRKKRVIVNGEIAKYSKGPETLKVNLPNSENTAVVTEHLLGHPHHILITRGRSQENYGPFIVPPDHFFVLGDHRDSADDSRFWGAIPYSDIEAKVLIIWLSLDWSEKWANDRLPTVRWERIFEPIR
jgi:signal peptidase I